VSELRRPPRRLPAIEDRARELAPGAGGTDALRDDDLHLCLYTVYELHYGGFDGVDPDWEWAPDLLSARGVLESVFEEALRSSVPVPGLPEPAAAAVADALVALVAADDSPSTSRFLESRATRSRSASSWCTGRCTS
jgi:hypothetical protein